MKLEPKAIIQIQLPAKVVFEGIVDPKKMTKYFISESTGRLVTGTEVVWKFPEFDETFPIRSIKVEDNKLISFVWDKDTRVTITLEELQDGGTIVRVNEIGKELTEENLKWAIENAGGWANFLACMKAYLEYGIQLRKGAYDFMRKK